MRFAGSLVWILFLFFFQIAAQGIFFDQTPSFVLIGVIFFALSRGPMNGFLAGLFGGFLIDLLGIGKMGYESMIFSCVGLICGYLSTFLFRDSLWTQLTVPSLANYLVQLSSLLWFGRLAGRPFQWGIFVDAWNAPGVFLTFFLSPFVFLFLRKATGLRPSGVKGTKSV